MSVILIPWLMSIKLNRHMEMISVYIVIGLISLMILVTLVGFIMIINEKIRKDLLVDMLKNGDIPPEVFNKYI